MLCWSKYVAVTVNASAILIFAAAVSAGCTRKSSADQDQLVVVQNRQAEPQKVRRGPDYFDEQGELLPSKEVIAGLTLPRGLKATRMAEGKHVFHTRVPIEKVLRYFGARLITGEVKRIGPGGVYREALPKPEPGQKRSGHQAFVKMDVSVLPSSRGTRVEVSELPPPPTQHVPAAELHRQMRNASKYLD